MYSPYKERWRFGWDSDGTFAMCTPTATNHCPELFVNQQPIQCPNRKSFDFDSVLKPIGRLRIPAGVNRVSVGGMFTRAFARPMLGLDRGHALHRGTQDV